MATLERAIEIAASAHAGQRDKGGSPYVLHPLRVMLHVTTDNERIAAVLHDVVEDTDVTLEQLRSEGFEQAVIDAVAALTKKPGESRLEAAARARANPIARVVKLADNADNMDFERIGVLSDKDVARLQEYVKVRAFLLAQPA